MAFEPVLITVPRETVNDESVKLLRWHVADGDKVTEGQALADVETSKAVLELEASASGFVKLLSKAGQEVGIGIAICKIVESLSEPDAPTVDAPPKTENKTASVDIPVKKSTTSHATILELASQEDPGILAVRFTPVAERMAAEAGLSLSDFRGMRIVKSEDVRARIDGKPPVAAAKEEPTPADKSAKSESPEKPTNIPGIAIEWDDLPRRKQVEIRQISGGTRPALLSSVTLAMPTTGLRAAVAASGVPNLSASVVIIYEAARLLKKYPMFNAVYWDGKAGLYQSINIGWAIDDGGGLMVPVIRDVADRSLPEIAADAQDIIERFIDGKLTVKDFVDGTFTISDLSSEGVFSFSPMISQGQSAILGVGAEFFVGRSPIGFQNFTLAFDHQLGDGRMAAKFLQDLAERLSGYESTFTPPAPPPPVPIAKSFAVPNDLTPAGLTPVETEVSRSCSVCFRDQETITEMNAYLLRSEIPKGFVCSLCLGGF